jgi:para-nitrobenzyl esterase
MQDAWMAFARTRNPGTEALPDWGPYAATRRSTMLLGTACHAVDAPYETERRFWEDAHTQ